MIIGYVRTSKRDQNLDRQLTALKEVCDEVRTEKGSAARRRPVLEAVLAGLKRGDSFVILDVDRAFRSTIEALKEAERLRKRGVHFRILNAQVDTATPEGELQYTLMVAYARYERRILIRRTKEGLEAARAKGHWPGPRPRLSREQLREAHARYRRREGTLAALAAELGVHRTTLSRSFDRPYLPRTAKEAGA